MDHRDIINLLEQLSVKVYETLGPGCSELVYRKALCLELDGTPQLSYRYEVPIPIYYGNEPLGATGFADLVVWDPINRHTCIVELKAVASDNQMPLWQLQCEHYRLNWHKANPEGQQRPSGFIVNFAQRPGQQLATARAIPTEDTELSE